jgi:hypothetical protein
MSMLEELQALPDAELIERVATDVMGWRRIETGGKHWWELPNGKFYEMPYFDPLTDWNHTMEVVKRMPRPFHLLQLSHTASWQAQCGDPPLYEVDANPQHAICIAALLAVSSSK